MVPVSLRSSTRFIADAGWGGIGSSPKMYLADSLSKHRSGPQASSFKPFPATCSQGVNWSFAPSGFFEGHQMSLCHYDPSHGPLHQTQQHPSLQASAIDSNPPQTQEGLGRLWLKSQKHEEEPKMSAFLNTYFLPPDASLCNHTQCVILEGIALTL